MSHSISKRKGLLKREKEKPKKSKKGGRVGGEGDFGPPSKWKQPKTENFSTGAKKVKGEGEKCLLGGEQKGE